MLEWSDSFLLGVQEFDEQHKKLVGLLNKSYEAYKFGTSATNLETIINELIAYAAYHFSAEERWMAKQSYPKLADHEIEHRNFTDKVANFQRDLLAGKDTVSVKLFTFLANWVRTHILETDSDYGRFNAAKGTC